MADFTPSPLTGEGGGEGGEVGTNMGLYAHFNPLSPTLPREGGRELNPVFA